MYKPLNIFVKLFLCLFDRTINFIQKLLTNKKAISGLILTLVVALVTIAIIIPIGLIITVNIGDAMNIVSAKNDTTTAENVTYDVFNNIYTSFSLSALVPIVAVAGLLITIIVGAFAFRRMQG